jgi:hypothetical protein
MRFLTGSARRCGRRSGNANTRTAVADRHRVILKKLLAFDPKFASNMSAVFQMGDLQASIDSTGRNLRETITTINQTYSRETGQDLIKMTNKSVDWIIGFNRKIICLDDWGQFIDGLYFVFKEGGGQRLLQFQLSSVKDINLIRTGLRHDVDHGKTKDVQKKRIAIAEAFERYSGERNPEVVDPTILQIAQLNVLGALLKDMSDLSKRFISEGVPGAPE